MDNGGDDDDDLCGDEDGSLKLTFYCCNSLHYACSVVSSNCLQFTVVYKVIMFLQRV